MKVVGLLGGFHSEAAVKASLPASHAGKEALAAFDPGPSIRDFTRGAMDQDRRNLDK